MLIEAIDLQFPAAGSPVWRWIWINGGRLQIDFDGVRRGLGGTGVLDALVDLAHDAWNSGSKTQMNDVLGRCDSTRLEKAFKGLLAAYARGRGKHSEEFLSRLLKVGPGAD